MKSPAVAAREQGPWRPCLLVTAVRNKDVSQSPDGLNKDGFGGIGFDQFAQARDLDVETAVESFVLAATRQFHEFVARQRYLGVACKYFEYGKFAGRNGHYLFALGQGA